MKENKLIKIKKIRCRKKKEKKRRGKCRLLLSEIK